MKLLQCELSEYVFKLLGLTLKLEIWPKATSFPRFLYDNYDFYCADFLEVQHLFLLCKNKKEDTPAAIKKQVALIKEKFLGEVVLVCPLILQHNRNRLIEYKIPFIIPGNQLYLPGSGIALREHFRQGHQEKQKLSPSAQVVVLNALVHGHYGPMTSTQIQRQLHYSAMTLTRAIDEIELLGLGMVETKGRERVLLFTEKKMDLWDKSLPFFRSPVKKSIYLHPQKGNLNYLKSGLFALGKQSMLAESEQITYALSIERFKAFQSQNHIEIISYPEPGAICFELWRYDPELLGKDNFVDPLSLYLGLKDSGDERVVAEAQTMVEGFFDTGN